MAELGLAPYRFSVAWPRIQPDGTGAGQPAGLDFYRRLVDELLGSGHRPVGHPLPLGPAAGAGGRAAAGRAGTPPTASPTTRAIVHDALGDRVRTGPRSTSRGARPSSATPPGVHAPGRRDPAAACPRRAPPAARRTAWPRRRCGASAERSSAVTSTSTLSPRPVRPATPAEDADAARRIDGLHNRFFLDPLLRGAYPADVLGDLTELTDLAYVRDGDLEIIASADRPARRQLLQPARAWPRRSPATRRRRRAPPLAGQRGRPVRRRRRAGHRDGLGDRRRPGLTETAAYGCADDYPACR